MKELLSIRERIEREEKTIEELRRRRQMREAADAAKKSTFDAQTSTARDTSGASLSIRDIGISLRSPQKGYAAIGHTTTIGLDRSQPPLPTTRPPPTPPKVDRSVGSSTLLDNDYMAHASSTASTYARDAEVRLNLFMNDPGKESETTV
ncbi:unnamed protein product, partial [Mesorhabditis spiculigera]